MKAQIKNIFTPSGWRIYPATSQHANIGKSINRVKTEDILFDFETPRALTTDEIPDIVEQFRQGAINAKQAGFDGVEIHAANGYLLDQFLKDGTNQRDDQYGGSIENRVRLTTQITQAVTEVWGGGDRVGIRISPTGTFNSMSDSDPEALYNQLVEQLNPYYLAYLHVVEQFGEEGAITIDFSALRQQFNGAYMANGGYTAERAEESLQNGRSDFISFGSPFISNPDLPQRLKQGAVLAPADQATFYGGGAKGYTDYPALEGSAV